MCEYCYKKDDDEIMGKTIRQFEWKETAGYESPEKRNDFLEMFILKCKNDKKAGLMIDNGYGYRYVDINYCMFCRKEAGRVNENYREIKFTEYVKHKGEPDWEIAWNKRMLELIDKDPTGGAKEKRLKNIRRWEEVKEKNAKRSD